GVGLHKLYAIAGKCVQIGAFYQWVTVAVQVGPAKIVGNDEENIRRSKC
ncbi:MAG: hypothetical protein ACI94D_001657, partial [Neolewinella sp.]